MSIRTFKPSLKSLQAYYHTLLRKSAWSAVLYYNLKQKEQKPDSLPYTP